MSGLVHPRMADAFYTAMNQTMIEDMIDVRQLRLEGMRALEGVVMSMSTELVKLVSQ